VEVLVTEDAPRPLNPLSIELVEGQLVGGFVQGLGGALSS
jgi:CO/xanthine dehydrogenase Mo-binding subunit